MYTTVGRKLSYVKLKQDSQYNSIPFKLISLNSEVMDYRSILNKHELCL